MPMNLDALRSRREDHIERMLHRAETRGLSFRPARLAPDGARSASRSYSLKVIASEDVVASDGDVVVTEGMRPDSDILTNKTIFLDHEYHANAGVGSLRAPTLARPGETMQDMGGGRKRLTAIVGLLTNGRQLIHHDQILEFVAHGIAGWSIGWTPDEMTPANQEDRAKYGEGVEYVHRRWNWHELSLTLFPCLISARTLGVIDTGDEEARMARAESLLTSGAIDQRAFASLAGQTLRPTVSLASPVSLAD
jgi:hypothetical protein